MFTRVILGLNRPRKLLLFINPYGGKKNALKLYEKYAKPIFRIANIDVSVIITQRSNQIFDLVLQQHLDHFDGIACCGGDGTFSELFNGLIYRDILSEHSNEPSKVDVNNIPRPAKPLGIIPAGSTDTIAYCLHGTTDIKTCIIHIVLGQTTGLDLSSVTNDKGIIKFYASVMSYGYLGDLLYESESLRWLGPKRYEYSGFKKVLRNRGYDVELLLLQEPENTGESDVIQNCDAREKIKCSENCSTCSANEAESKPSGDEKYKRVTGKFFMVNGANISCACDRSPSGMSPYSHVGDGYLNVICVRHGSIWNNLKLLLTLSRARGEIESLPFVEFYRTKKFHFKALNSSSEGSLADSTQPISIAPSKHCSVWNCDGEILQETDVTVRWVCLLNSTNYRFA
jgi:ceramide kinase